MPHTYPSPQQGKTNDTYHTSPIPPRQSSSAPQSSRYLTPVQQQRILSWRSTASVASGQTPPTSPSKVKSAPASLSLSMPGGTSSTTSPCPACAAKSICSCSTKSPKSAKQRSYYSNKNKRSATTTLSAMTPVTPMTGLTTPDRRGMPNAAQIHAHQYGTAPPPQFGPAPSVPLPEPALAIPPTKPDLPRIAGSRDPISQNYWRQMFPPAPGPGTPFVQPGIQPSQVFGMPMGRPWGF